MRRYIFVLPLVLMILASLSYGVTVPSNIIAYIPITFTNQQSTAVAANTPLSFVFNALAYPSYETNTLNNTELFFGNGTTASSWLEGNYLNEQQQANHLYTSNSVLFWFKSPNGFLPANTGIAPTNTIYLGFTGTSLTPSNNLWSLTANVGVAPQLTCSNPASTATCSAGNGVSGIYGQYDNGANMFIFYDNFNGNTINSQWIGSGETVNNGLTEGGFATLVSKTSYDFRNYILSTLGTTASYYSFIGFGNAINVHACVPSGAATGEGLVYGCDGEGQRFYISTPTNSYPTINFGPDGYGRPLTNLRLWLDPNWLTDNTAYGAINNVNYSGSGVLTNALPSQFLAANIVIGGYDNGGTASLQYASVMQQPPNDIYPSYLFNDVTPYNVVLTSSPTLSATLDSGQSIIFNSLITGGESSYTYNYIITNTITSNVFFSQQYSTSSTTNSLTWTPTITSKQTLKANVIVTDSYPTTTNSVYLSTLTFNPALVVGTLTETNTIIDNGQHSTLTSGPSGGTTAYSYNWFQSTTGNPSCNNANVIGGANSATYPASPTSNTYYTYNVIDSATTPVSLCSPSNEVIVYPALTGLTLSTGSAPANQIDIGQNQTLTATTDGGTGTPPYQYSFSVYNSPIIAQANLVYSFNTPYTYSTSNSITFPEIASYGTGSFTANILLCDSASTPVCITNSIGYTVNSMVSAIVSPKTATIGFQNTQNYTGTITGGVGPYTANWVTYYGKVKVGNLTITGINSISSYGYLATFMGTFNTTLTVTDSLQETISTKNATLMVLNPSNPGGGSTGTGTSTSTTTIPSNTPSITPLNCNVTSGTATAALTNIGISEYNTYFGKSQYFGNSITVMGFIAIIFMAVITIITFTKKKLRWLAILIDIALVLPAIVAIGVQCVRV